MPEFISLEGCISSGKSTIISILTSKNYPNVFMVKEPVDEWMKITDNNNNSIFDLFYNDKKSYAFSLQIYALFTRYKALKAAYEYALEWEKNNEGQIMKIISERTILSDYYIFASLLYKSEFISEIDFKIYTAWFEKFSSEFHISKIIYVKTDPEVCFQRVKTRNRHGEENITLNYLTDIIKQHDFLKEYKFDNYLEINNDVHINSEEYQENIKNIFNFIFN